ncbi:MAG: dihydroorotate dehydrogenase [Pseudomonadota bacterium]
MSAPCLAVELCGVRLQAPLVLASGILGVSASSMAFAVAQGAGAVTTKSVARGSRAGHKNPVVAPFAHGLLNAVGLSGPGAAAMAEEVRAFRARSAAPVIASVFGADPEEFAEVTATLAAAGPAMVEVNVSCPNVGSEFGTPFSADPVLTGEITRAVVEAAGGIPVTTKLSLHCPSLAAMARACEDAGASALTAINTVGPGMIIEPGLRRPVLSNRVGGLSGPAILPLAVRAVWELYEAGPLPILGTGGVSSAEDALQLIMAGARAVGLGTAVWLEGVEVFGRINGALAGWLAREGVASLGELVGVAHG